MKASLAAQNLPVVPMIVFAKGGHYALAQLGESGYDVVGLDWTIRPEEARRLVGDNVSLQVSFFIHKIMSRMIKFFLNNDIMISVLDPNRLCLDLDVHSDADPALEPNRIQIISD